VLYRFLALFSLPFQPEQAQNGAMQSISRIISLGLCALALGVTVAAQAAAPVITWVRGTTNNSVPSGMVLIPAGPFTMGDTFGEGDSSELPLHTNQISAFYIAPERKLPIFKKETLGNRSLRFFGAF
jgi:formylglycine-generating enzyme required for sulfatase activity